MAKKSAAQKSLPVVDEAEAIVEPSPAFVDAGVIIEPAQRDDVAVIAVHVDSIADSPTNPRKTMGDLTELAESIKKAGVLQPILVRKVNLDVAGRPYEVVFGHRRLHAARVAGLAEILAQVRDLTDQQVAELQLVENAQREDVSPLEEADAYRRLHEEFGLSADAIAQRVGKSKASVYARMKLADLKDEKARGALNEGKIDASTALLIARLKPADQAKASKRIVDGLNEYGRPYENGQPLSYRNAVAYLRNELYLHITDAPFDVSDASLVATAGACTKCPKRVDVNGLTIVGQKVGEGDLCDDEACWSKKVVADRDAKLGGESAKTGIRPLSASENAKLFENDRWTPGEWSSKAAFVEPARTPTYEDSGAYQNNTSWEELLKRAWKKLKVDAAADCREVLVLALDRDSKVVELVDRKKAVKLIKQAGLFKKPKSSTGSSTGASEPKKPSAAAELVEKAEAEVERAVKSALLAKAKASPELDAKLLRFFVAEAVGSYGVFRAELGALGAGITYEKASSFEKLGALPSNTVRSIAVLAMIKAAGEMTLGGVEVDSTNGKVTIGDEFKLVGKILGVDVDALEKKATADVGVEVKRLAWLKKNESDQKGGRWNERGHWVTKTHVAIPSEDGEGGVWIPIADYNRNQGKVKSEKDPFKAIASAGRKAVKKIVAKSSKKPKAKK